MDHDIQFRADRLLAEYLELIEGAWLDGERIGLGPRFVLAVEMPRPDGLSTFAFRATPWHSLVEVIRPWQESEVVVVFVLAGGATMRTIPRPRGPCCPGRDGLEPIRTRASGPRVLP